MFLLHITRKHVFKTIPLSDNFVYLLYLRVCGHSRLHISLLLKPGADSLKGTICTSPAIVIHTILHVVMITVHALHQIQLQREIQDKDKSVNG